MELKYFGRNICEDSNYLERENKKRQELAEKFGFKSYAELRKTIKWLNDYSYHKHGMNTSEHVGIAMCDILYMSKHPDTISCNEKNYIGGRFNYKSLKLSEYVDKIHEIERYIGWFYNNQNNYPHSNELINNFLNNEENISDFTDALILANIVEDLMFLEVFYTMEYHIACGMSLHDQSLALYNFYNDLFDYIFSSKKNVIEKMTKDIDEINKSMDDEEKRCREESNLNDNTETGDKHSPKQQILST